MNSPYDSFTENDDDEVGGVIEPIRNRVPTATPRNPDQKKIIPLIGFDFNKEKRRNPETGQMEDIDVPTVKSRSDSLRICDTCFLAAKCPMFEENSTCAYDIPITIRTKDQAQALMDTLVEIQAQRVLFMKMAEDAEGGHADPILSGEMDRLMKMMDTKHKMEQEGFTLTVTAKQNGQAGIVDKIFGNMGDTSKLRELESAVDPEDVANTFDVDF